MIYILTTILCGLGICFHIMQKIRILRTKFPEFVFKRIWGTFFTEEWDTLFVSFICWLVLELAIYIVLYNKVHIATWFAMWGIYVLALVWGYCGQRIAYKYLGTAEEVLEKKADDLKNIVEKTGKP